ncbi:MAG: amidase family protein, partial [Curtobacterium sp.]
MTDTIHRAPDRATDQTPEHLADWSAVRLADAVASREVSAVEVMRAHLERIEERNPRLRAVVSQQPDSVSLAAAEAADRRTAEARAEGEPLPLLHGLPTAVKDLMDVAGMPTTNGSAAFADATPAAHDSVLATLLRDAGAIIIGKTNTPELGLGSHTYNPVHGTTRNPYDLGRTAGGSSGGAAVAVALRMVPVADGSDFMGSLRNPPGWTNVYGLRPSFGRVPTGGGDVFVNQGSVDGPIARTPLDLALLLDTMAGYDARAPLSIPAPGVDHAAL